MGPEANLYDSFKWPAAAAGHPEGPCRVTGQSLHFVSHGPGPMLQNIHLGIVGVSVGTMPREDCPSSSTIMILGPGLNPHGTLAACPSLRDLPSERESSSAGLTRNTKSGSDHTRHTATALQDLGTVCAEMHNNPIGSLYFSPVM